MTDSPAILIVEDDPTLRKLLERYLTQQGYRVRSASRAREALEHLHQPATVPDLILSDFSLSGMDGAELLHQVRWKRADLPVVFLSGLHPDAVLRVCTEKPDAILKKPVALAQLRDVIIDLIK